jgi:hypothetical protein
VVVLPVAVEDPGVVLPVVPVVVLVPEVLVVPEVDPEPGVVLSSFLQESVPNVIAVPIVARNTAAIAFLLYFIILFSGITILS